MVVNSKAIPVMLVCVMLSTTACLTLTHVPREPVAVAGSSLPVQVGWEYFSEARIGAVLSSLAYVDGKVYFSSGSHVHKLDVFTGGELWTYDAKGDIWQFQVDERLVVFLADLGIGGDILVVLNADTGRLVWQQKETLFRSFCLCDGQLIAALEGHIRAYDPATGEQLWDNQEAATSHWGTHVLYEDGLLYVEAETLRVLDADTGRFIQEFQVQTDPGQTRIFEGILYTLDDEGEKLTAIDGRTGSIVWSKRYRPDSYHYPPTLADGVLYFPDKEGNILAVDSTNGSLLWKYSSSSKVRVLSNIAVFDGVVYTIYPDDTLRGIDTRTGYEVGRLQATGVGHPDLGEYAGVANVVSAGDTLLATFDGATLFALQAQ